MLLKSFLLQVKDLPISRGNTLAADAPSTWATWASSATMLKWLTQNIPASALGGLSSTVHTNGALCVIFIVDVLLHEMIRYHFMINNNNSRTILYRNCWIILKHDHLNNDCLFIFPWFARKTTIVSIWWSPTTGRVNTSLISVLISLSPVGLCGRGVFLISRVMFCDSKTVQLVEYIQVRKSYELVIFS